MIRDKDLVPAARAMMESQAWSTFWSLDEAIALTRAALIAFLSNPPASARRREGGRMSNQKIKACPRCGSPDHMAVYSYENGARHVECDNGQCQYLGPPSGSIRGAIILHNEAQQARQGGQEGR